MATHALETDRWHDSGPFDIIGDVHGCADELEALLGLLGYRITWPAPPEGGPDAPPDCTLVSPPGRRLILLGDLVDRGPRIADTLRIAMALVAGNQGLCVLGNHEYKLLRWLRGHAVHVSQGLQASLDQLDAAGAVFQARVEAFLASLPCHIWLDGGRLAVAHAGIKADMMGKTSRTIQSFCLYGAPTGERDADGLPVRLDWAQAHDGTVMVVYGHTPVAAPEWRNNTLNIDTGCVFGGRLTALRYPERTLLSVPAAQVYVDSARRRRSPTGGAGSSVRPGR